MCFVLGVKDAWKEALQLGLVEQFGCYEFYEESADVFVDEGVWQGWKMVPRAFCLGTFLRPECSIEDPKAAAVVRKTAEDILAGISPKGLPLCGRGCCHSQLDPRYRLQTEIDPRFIVPDVDDEGRPILAQSSDKPSAATGELY